MKTFTCFSWVCVLTLLFIGHSSGAEMLDRRSVIEKYIKEQLAAMEKRLKADEASVKQTISDLRNELAKQKEMEERRSVFETYVQKKLDALEKKLKTEIDANTALQSQVSNLNKAVKKLEADNEKLKDTLKVQKALQKEIAGLKALGQGRVAALERKVGQQQRIETSRVCQPYNGGGGAGRAYSVTVKFHQPYVTLPKVVLGLNRLDIDGGRNIRHVVEAQSITRKGFVAHFETWGKSITYHTCVDWISVGK